MPVQVGSQPMANSVTGRANDKDIVCFVFTSFLDGKFMVDFQAFVLAYRGGSSPTDFAVKYFKIFGCITVFGSFSIVLRLREPLEESSAFRAGCFCVMRTL